MHFFSHFHVHESVELFLHAFMHFMWWKKTGLLNNFFKDAVVRWILLENIWLIFGKSLIDTIRKYVYYFGLVWNLIKNFNPLNSFMIGMNQSFLVWKDSSNGRILETRTTVVHLDIRGIISSNLRRRNTSF